METLFKYECNALNVEYLFLEETDSLWVPSVFIQKPLVWSRSLL